jgi:hypothetical protein
MLHRTGSRKLHTAKKLTVHHPIDQPVSSHDTANTKNGEKKEDVHMKQALMEMDGTIINSSGPTFGDYLTNR